MSAIVSIHSFRGGTGKSNITASVATLVAGQGKKVGVVDTDIQSPGMHVIFGLEESRIEHSLNDYLWGRCSIEAAAHQVPCVDGGTLYLIPSAMKTGEIARVLREGYDVSRLNDGFRDLMHGLDLDYLFIDTHPGLNEETLLSIAISDTLLILMRPDRQDYEGTGVTVEVARRLDVPRLLLIVNKVPSALDKDEVRRRVVETYSSDVIAVLPLAEEMMGLGSSGVFVTRFPDHDLSRGLGDVAQALLVRETRQ